MATNQPELIMSSDLFCKVNVIQTKMFNQKTLTNQMNKFIRNIMGLGKMTRGEASPAKASSQALSDRIHDCLREVIINTVGS
jgi:hypothetical protein